MAFQQLKGDDKELLVSQDNLRVKRSGDKKGSTRKNRASSVKSERKVGEQPVNLFVSNQQTES